MLCLRHPSTKIHTPIAVTRDPLQACIDQSDIERSLSCLPIFLSGCKTLLIVAGPTCAGAASSPQATPWSLPAPTPYTTLACPHSRPLRYCKRLWCVMEVFTFLRMGGAIGRIELKMIAHPDADTEEARGRLAQQFERFDAAKAQCFKNEDRQRLLAVIEAAFGDFKQFNVLVRAAFAARAPCRLIEPVAA